MTKKRRIDWSAVMILTMYGWMFGKMILWIVGIDL